MGFKVYDPNAPVVKKLKLKTDIEMVHTVEPFIIAKPESPVLSEMDKPSEEKCRASEDKLGLSDDVEKGGEDRGAQSKSELALKKDGPEEELLQSGAFEGFPIEVRRYLAGYAINGTKRCACKHAMVGYHRPDQWIDELEGFEAAEARARDIYADSVERMLFEKMSGNPTLLIFALKGLRPEKYRDNYNNTIIGSGGITVMFNVPRPQQIDTVEAVPMLGKGSSSH